MKVVIIGIGVIISGVTGYYLGSELGLIGVLIAMVFGVAVGAVSSVIADSL